MNALIRGRVTVLGTHRLFDIHGEGGTGSFRLATHGGITARADALNDGLLCLRALVAAAGLNVTSDTVAAETRGFSYIPGFLHGTTLPSELEAATDPPVPPPGRLHGMHVEIARSYRLPPGQPTAATWTRHQGGH